MAILQTGQDWDVINTPLTTSYTEVTYTRPLRNYLVQCREDVNVRVKRLNADTKYFTIKAGSAANKDIIAGAADMASSSLGFYATETGTANLEVIVIFG